MGILLLGNPFAHPDLYRNRLNPKFSRILGAMYEDLRNVIAWEERLPIMAREFGQSLANRKMLLLFGPRYITQLFSPQARRLEAELRQFGVTQAGGFPAPWQPNWPGRDQERLYFLIEDIQSRDEVLRCESRAEDSKAGIFYWNAGPVEVDLIFPTLESSRDVDPRLEGIETLASLAIFRIGASRELPILATMSLPEAIRSLQSIIKDVKDALGIEASTNPKKEFEAEVALNQADTPTPRRDAWIKA